MEDTLRLYFNNGVRTLQKPSYYFPSPHLLHISSISRNFDRFIIHSRISSSSSSSKTSITLPQKPSQTPPKFPDQPQPQPSGSFDIHSGFRDKILYLDSIGIDLFSLIDDADYPLNLILSSSLEDMKSTVNFMRSMGFTALEFRRICGMCPEILNCKISDIIPVITFLLREANVMGSDLRRVINRRPRLLACDVEKRLRPTLYFLQSLGISEVHRYTSLLSCSVEDKFIPRIEYLEKIGFSYGDAISMVRRFPQLFCYSIKHNFEPKFDYFFVEMGRDLTELKEFPQYFSFSLENRIKPRHQFCVQKGVYFPLPVLLKTCQTQFHDTLEI
ncbi:Mitochodrial transcription termination factor-related [Macleaya cordata]|uniref:Mitochodrial transcription termination factor-related n=1 Tax=Macleaya cordata TaxID=56857 RepID=A0A200R9J0_MACCD|nr:Mitochodrial transcription termination factor-related [Macleaya cordata]